MVELSATDKIALSNYRYQKSKETLLDSVTNLNSGAYKTSINRSYYAVLHAARSLLILKGIDPLRHEGIKTMLSLHFIKTNLLPPEAIMIYKYLFSLRTDVDYGDFEIITASDASDALDKAKRFLEIVEPLREQLVRELECAT